MLLDLIGMEIPVSTVDKVSVRHATMDTTGEETDVNLIVEETLSQPATQEVFGILGH